jgi:RNA polymerase sigma-70 factor (ECF subfamily)
MDTTPASLLERLRQPGERHAWDRFVDLYTPLIYSWACRMGLQAEDAADLVQEVFIVLLHKMAEFHYDPQRSFRAWLRTVVVNKWHDIRRRSEATLRGGAADGLSGVAIADPARSAGWAATALSRSWARATWAWSSRPRTCG